MTVLPLFPSLPQLLAPGAAHRPADKADENAAMAALQRVRYPADRLLPMPAEIHHDWTAEEVEQVRTHSARLAAAEGNTTLANNWRLRLREPRGQYWMRMDARERVTAGAERRAALRAGKDVETGLVFSTAGLEDFPAPREAPAPKARRQRRSVTAASSSLSDRLRAGYCVLSVIWHDHTVPPPGGLDRDVWAFAVPLDEDMAAVERIYAPATTPGAGWSYGKAIVPRQGAKWSQETKGRVRRKLLRNRLEKKLPLFADLFFQQELQRTPEYFAGKPVAAAPTVIEPTATMIGHNGGPAWTISEMDHQQATTDSIAPPDARNP